MRIDEFRQRLDALGADLSQWPAAEARAARCLLDADAQAHQCLMRARQLDAAVHDALQATHASASLRLRLQRIPAHYPQPARAAPVNAVLDPRRWLIRGAMLAGFAATAGFVAGFAGLLVPDIGLNFFELAYGGPA